MRIHISGSNENGSKTNKNVNKKKNWSRIIDVLMSTNIIINTVNKTKISTIKSVNL